MKSKFLSLILSLAVIAGLMLVPATLPGVPAGVALGSSNVTVSIVPSTTYVSPNGSFTIDAVINNPDGMEVAMHAVRLDFDPSYFTVDSVSLVDFVEDMGSPVINNSAGMIDYDPKMGTGDSINKTPIISARINCTAGSSEGVSTVDYVYTSGRLGKVTYGLTDYLEAGNMSLMLSGTVIIGSPNLTVDVSPVGKGGVSGFGPFPDVSSRSWFEVVSVDAVDTTLGWTFDHWVGDIDFGATTDPNQVTMNALSRSATAVFVEKPCDLEVDPNTVNFTGANALRFGDNEANDTVEVSNAGGGTLCWAVGELPTWSKDDNWTYWNSYSEYPPGTPFTNPYYDPGAPCLLNDTVLVMTVTGEDADNYYGFADWPIDPQRTSSTTAALCMHNASITVDKCTLDYVHQHANLTIVPLGLPTFADVTWEYTSGCHGWPYYLGKTWAYNMTVTDVQHTFYVDGYASVTALLPSVHPIANGLTDVYEITHYLVTPASPFMQQYWSDTVRNFVYQWDGGTYLAPPLDIRVLVDQNPGPAAPAGLPGGWLSVDPMSGELGIEGSQDVTVTVNSSGVPCGTWPRNFTVSACCDGIQEEIVDVLLEVKPAAETKVMRNLPGNDTALSEKWPGDTFDVYVNFSAPFNNTNAISLTDLAPDGWEVAVDAANCTADDPGKVALVKAMNVKATGNKVEVTWWGDPNVGFNETTNFSALYQVTVPETPKPGINKWPDNDCSKAWAEYYEGEADLPEEPYTSCVVDEYRMTITVPGYATGETRDVNANPLPDTTVVLKDTVWAGSDESTPDYSIECRNTGVYYLKGMKDAYWTVETPEIGSHGVHNVNHTVDINWSTPELLADSYHVVGGVNHVNLDFEGDYGLVPQSCNMSYAMKSVNLYVFSPAPIIDTHNGIVTDIDLFGLSVWKATRSVNSWLTPYHPTP